MLFGNTLILYFLYFYYFCVKSIALDQFFIIGLSGIDYKNMVLAKGLCVVVY